jgi:two-component system, sensor histidine kinase
MGRPSRSALIVSDSAALRRYMASTLEVAGFTATEASSGFQAMDCLSERMFDLYLVDLDIASSDGMAIFAITLTGGFRDPSPVIVGVSDQPQEEAVRPPWGDATSFAALFAKPFRPDDLIAAVETALAPQRPSVAAHPSDF